jgi:hypothetical protein
MSPAPHHTPAARRWTLPTIWAILLVGGVLTSSLLTACLRRGPEDAPPAAGGGATPAAGALPPKLFDGWPTDAKTGLKKPDVALILSGQQHSYLKFCGCSTPQLGGFERRYNFMMTLKGMGWPLVAADLGDLVEFTDGIHDQALLKYETAMKALEVLTYSAIGLGVDDFSLPLIDGMARFTLQRPNAFPRVLAANLDPGYRAANFPNAGNGPPSMIGDWQPATVPGAPPVGITSLIGNATMKDILRVAPQVQFAPNSVAVLQAVLKEMNAAKVEFRVLLYHGPVPAAQKIAQQFPNQFHVILCQSDEDTPPAQPQVVGQTNIIRVGHKGKFVGVVGAYRTGKADKPFDLHYQVAPLGEDFETAKAKEAGHPVLKLLDWYAQEVKVQGLLERTPVRPVPVPAILAPQNVKLSYVGTEKCLSCHQAEAAVWQKSKHAHAYNALVNVANKPTMRQYDPECIKCHVVGYSFPGGFVNHVKTTDKMNVGCESCHGPGSAHSTVPGNEKFKLAMSPWKGDDKAALLPSPATLKQGFAAMTPKEQAVYNRVNGDMCQKCHDPDNDPHFKFEEYWPKVIHGKNAGKANAPAAAVKAVLPPMAK